MELNDQGNRAGRAAQRIDLGGKSWIAFAQLVAGHLIVLLIAGVIGALIHPLAGLGLMACVAALAVYRFLELRSWRLFADEAGIWLERGVLPWSRGVSGVKWCDLDEAAYRTGFWSWLCRSHDVFVTHRYTKRAEIAFAQLAGGPKAVQEINAIHQRLISAATAMVPPAGRVIEQR